MTKQETFSLVWHQDGHGEKLIAGNLTRIEAELRLDHLSAKCGQPVLDGDILNESGEENCGYYFIASDDVDTEAEGAVAKR